jgi:hypothetical protein
MRAAKPVAQTCSNLFVHLLGACLVLSADDFKLFDDGSP